MTHVGSVPELVADAQRVLGDDDPVLVAGAFYLQGFMKQTVGNPPPGALADGEDVDTWRRAAELQPMTMRLIVAVTATKIHVLTWETGDHPQRIVASFTRATTTATRKHYGTRRVLRLEDSATGAEMNLSASTGRMFPSTGPDDEVLAELLRSS